jgi:antitoxin VapB
MAAVISRVFMNGNSQAVRIPQEFRLNVNRVQVSRNEAGDLVIRPLPLNRGVALLAALQDFDDELLDDVLGKVSEDYQTQPPVQEREPLWAEYSSQCRQAIRMGLGKGIAGIGYFIICVRRVHDITRRLAIN